MKEKRGIALTSPERPCSGFIPAGSQFVLAEVPRGGGDGGGPARHLPQLCPSLPMEGGTSGNVAQQFSAEGYILIYALWHQNYRHAICVCNIARVFLARRIVFCLPA